MRLRGGRTGVRAVICEGLELTGLMQPVRHRDLLRRAGRRARRERRRQVALPAAARRRRRRAHRRVAARARGSSPGCSRRRTRIPSGTTARWSTCCGPATTDRPRRRPRPGDGGAAALRAASSRPSRRSARCPAASRRGSRSCCSSCPARPCCCSTSRPTTSTCISAEALEEALDTFDGTVLAVTHDRWFARSFDRFLVFGADGRVYESTSRCSTRRGVRAADARGTAARRRWPS